METWEKWDRLLEIANINDILQELYCYMSSDEIEEFIEHFASLYNIESEEFKK